MDLSRTDPAQFVAVVSAHLTRPVDHPSVSFQSAPVRDAVSLVATGRRPWRARLPRQPLSPGW
jgi:hypothetical protein